MGTQYVNGRRNCILSLIILCIQLFPGTISAQTVFSKTGWIRPSEESSPSVWGIKNGIVFGLWPYAIESNGESMGGGPRGLIRIGYEFKGIIYHINYIAIEPLVARQLEFSEISPSKVDDGWGKLMWASGTNHPGIFAPYARSRGVIKHPDSANPEVEELSLYVYMEKFLNGAHPYLRLSIRSDRPEEICFEVFNQDGSAAIERCALTATMGNYSRLRLLHLKDQIIDSRKLYKGFTGIDFVEKEGYPIGQMVKNKNGDFIVVAEPNESFEELSSWPQSPEYYARWNWRYRPFFKLSQYWRKEGPRIDSTLHVRVNGRAKYWSGGINDKSKYIDIPGGPAFENFELREKYSPGQKVYFGISRKSANEVIDGKQNVR